MPPVSPTFIGRAFFAVADAARFHGALEDLQASLNPDCGFFAGDNLITWNKSAGWMDDEVFVNAFNAHATTAVERTIAWRSATLAWAVRQALRVDGDLVECGCYQGATARILYDVAGLASSPRKLFLYDLFDGAAGVARHAMPAHGPELEAQVRERFRGLDNVVITQGSVPESFGSAAPEKIAFLHIDMNNADAEIGALDGLFERITPGGVIVLDDYGWTPYRAQLVRERAWFADRGYCVLELPTGQGMVIR
ncbi:MAG: TylF/MycF/NovP-related O-methyltransferase [Phenylobacterium sp.]